MIDVLLVPVCSVNIAYLPSLALFIDGVRSAHPEAHANARVDIEGFSGAAGGQVGCRVNQRLRPCEIPHTAECLHVKTLFAIRSLPSICKCHKRSP